MSEDRARSGQPSGRLLAIGDIHGCDVALDALLDHARVTARDTVVVLGDLIDRGPGTKQVIDRLMEIAAHCRLIVVKGNHEEMLLDGIEDVDVREDWLAFGGFATLHSYGLEVEEVPKEHLDFLRGSVDYFATESAVLIHANLEPGVALEKQSAEWLRWVKLSKHEQPLPSGRRVVCGHTPQKTGLPWVGDGWVCIDTLAYGGLFLTCLDLTNDLVYQARQSGESRGPVPLKDCASKWGLEESKTD
jgi:serine/threonine protein phosphatase 1